MYDKVIPSTVLVITQSGETQGTGTGIFATEDGYIITNSHVILNSKSVSVQVKTYDGELHDAVVVGFDKTTDLAVLKIDGTGYMPAEFGDSDDLRMGQWVVAIGNPGGEQFSGSITRGVISGLNRSVGSYSSNGMTYIQTDAAINPGNSGGALVNAEGEVVGINSAKIAVSGVEGIGFAIPINSAKPILDELAKKGRVVRPYIGASLVDKDIANRYGFDIDLHDGIFVMKVWEGSPSAKAGLRPGDIILKFNGEKIDKVVELRGKLAELKVGDSVDVVVLRGGAEETIHMTLEEIPEENR